MKQSKPFYNTCIWSVNYAVYLHGSGIWCLDSANCRLWGEGHRESGELRGPGPAGGYLAGLTDAYVLQTGYQLHGDLEDIVVRGYVLPGGWMDVAGNQVSGNDAHRLERKVPDERGRWLGGASVPRVRRTH